MSLVKSKYRTHKCSELRAVDADKQVILSGWVMRKRDHGGLLFIDLRDHYGVTQLVASDTHLEALQKLKVESVICVHGKVIKRLDELINNKVETGEIEVQISDFEVLSESKVLPFQIAEEDNAPEAIRLKHRFLELRKEKLHKNVLLRSQVTQAVRENLTKQGFTEFHTPILTSSSPEGARDFIVPSRIHPGKFFALPQAPQQFKQLLMVSGFDRYFQIAPCFRDEDARADRSPGEFYQIDLEMSFVEQDDVFLVLENLLVDVFSKFSEFNIPNNPFPRIPYKESMDKYACDKPDLRNSLEIVNCSNVFENSEFKIFREVVAAGGSVKAINVATDKVPSRKYFDDLISNIKKEFGLGLAYLVYEGADVKGPILKFMSEAEKSELLKLTDDTADINILFFVAGVTRDTYQGLAKLRDNLGTDFNKVNLNSWAFCWIIDYPMYEFDDTTGKIEFSHNPFSMPQGGMEALETKDPLEIKAYQYDIVCNGIELSSGAIRNHRPEIMYKAFEIAGYGKEVVEEKFGGMLKAFQYGAPPHGGSAPGLDRIVMLLAEESAIRDVIAFPLAQSCEDLMMSAPSDISTEQLKEVHIRLDLPKEK